MLFITVLCVHSPKSFRIVSINSSNRDQIVTPYAAIIYDGSGKLFARSRSSERTKNDESESREERKARHSVLFPRTVELARRSSLFNGTYVNPLGVWRLSHTFTVDAESWIDPQLLSRRAESARVHLGFREFRFGDTQPIPMTKFWRRIERANLRTSIEWRKYQKLWWQKHRKRWYRKYWKPLLVPASLVKKVPPDHETVQHV